jgi:hypothetical protein
MPIALVGDGAPMPSKGGVAPTSGVVMPGGLTCATAALQPNKATPALQPKKIVKAPITDKRIMAASIGGADMGSPEREHFREIALFPPGLR